MVMLGGHVVLEEEVEIGASSAIRQGLTVDIKSMVGMGAIVTNSIAANTVVVGNPAKPFVKS